MSNDVDVIAPAPTLLAGDIGVIKTFPAPTLSATMSWPGDGLTTTVEVSAPVPGLSISVTVGNIAPFAGTAPAPTLVAVATSPAIITVSISASAPLLVATALTGQIITFSGTAPAPTLSTVMWPAITATFDNTAPAPYLGADIAAAITAAFRTWVLNTRKAALTEYGDEWAFNSYAYFNNKVLACGASGIVELGVHDLDNATEIDATWTTGRNSFGSSFHKRVPRAYIGYDTDGDIQLSVITPEGGTRTYQLAYNNTTELQQRRIPIGKGIKGRYFQFSMSNVDGADFSVDNLLIYPTVLKRRVM